METKGLKELASRVLSKTSHKEETDHERGKQSFPLVSIKGNSKPNDICIENDKSFEFQGYGKNQGNRETGPLPYLNKYGDLIIPFGSDSRYHWWAGGQTVEETIMELKLWVH